MNIILTESQLKKIKLSEQIMFGAGPLSAPNNIKRVSNISADDAVDYTSAAFDTIPEIGNAISLGIDIVHAITYAYRFANANDDRQKIEFAVMGILSTLTAAVPVMGNTANIAARGGLKGMLKRSPEEILRIAQKLGLYNQKIWPLQKSKWIFNAQLFLFKVTKGEIEEFAIPVTNKLKQITTKLKDGPIRKALIDFQSVLSNIHVNKQLYIQMAEHI